MSKETIVSSAFRVHRSKFSCSLAAALLDDLFDHPAGFSDGICDPWQGCIPGVSKLFFNSLLETRPTLPFVTMRMRWGWMQGRRPETDHRFTLHDSRFLGAGQERRRWSRIVRRSRRVGVGQAPGGKALMQDEEQSGLLPLINAST